MCSYILKKEIPSFGKPVFTHPEKKVNFVIAFTLNLFWFPRSVRDVQWYV